MCAITVFWAGCGNEGNDTPPPSIDGPTISKPMPATPKPELKLASVTSVPASDTPTDALTDGKDMSWWCAPSDTTVIKFTLEAETDLAGLEIWAGAHNPIHPELGDAFVRKSRVKVANVILWDANQAAKIFVFELEDTDRKQFISLPGGSRAAAIDVKIREVFPGEDGELCISHLLPKSSWPDENLPVSKAIPGSEMPKKEEPEQLRLNGDGLPDGTQFKIEEVK